MDRLHRPAGVRLLEWAQTPMGEEVIEGTMGGLLAGVPLFFQDNDPAAAALGTAGAIAGGIAMGMAGRRVGAEIGKRVHKDALKDQNSLGAFIGRTAGQETIGKALEENGKMMRGHVADYLVNKQAAKMVAEGIADPASVETLLNLRQMAAIKDSYQSLPPQQRAAFEQSLNQYSESLKGVAGNKLKSLMELESKLATGAVEGMDQALMKAAEELEKEMKSGALGDVKLPISPDMLRGMTGDATPVTGEHVGRAIGRFAGDEIGVLGGLGLGLLGAQALGVQTPKDREIERLREELEASK